MIVVFSVIALDKAGIDDPVGAISVHGTCGIWGILAAYFFQIEGSGVILASQIKGIALVGGAAFVFSIVVFGAIKAIMGVRVTEEEEIAGTEQGNTLVLTIDRAVQAAGYSRMINAGRRRAAVAINAGQGEIIALVSNPSFDPNILSSGTIEQRGKHFREVKRHNGFLNLTIQGK